MPQFLLAAAVGAVAYAAWKLIGREMGRVAGQLTEARARPEAREPARLVRDADGVYRPEISDR